MSIIRSLIERPIAVNMFYMALMVVGGITVSKLPVELYPGLEFPKLFIITQVPGATPLIVEKLVTSKIEGVCYTIPNVRKVSSRSYKNYSRIEIEFAENTQMDLSVLELREKLALVEREFPPGIMPPQIQKYSRSDIFDIDFKEEFLVFRLTGALSVNELKRLAEEKIRPPLLGVAGISAVQIFGGLDREIRVVVDRDKLDSYGISGERLLNEIQGLNIKAPMGSVTHGDRKYTVTVNEQILNARQLESHSIALDSMRNIPVKSFAEVMDTHVEPTHITRLNGNQVIRLTIVREPGTNILDVRERVMAKIKEVATLLPSGVTLIKDRDSGLIIDKEINTLIDRTTVAVVIVFIILLVTLRNVGVPLIILSTIGFSTLLTLSFFYVFDVGINLLTLSGLALGLGMIDDNSIVVLDNILRYREKGYDPVAAAVQGVKMISMPMIASTLTTVVVFIPLLYMTGENRIVFVPFALAITFSLLSSLLVAFTLIPSVAVRFFKRHDYGDEQSDGFKLIASWYTRLLKIALKYRWVALAAIVGLFIYSYHLFDRYVVRDKISRVLSGKPFLYVGISLPTGSDINATDGVISEFESIALREPGKIEMVETNVYEEYAYIRIDFPDSVLVTGFPSDLMSRLVVHGVRLGGIDIRVFGLGEGVQFTGIGSDVTIDGVIGVKGYNLDVLAAIAEDIGNRLRANPRVENVTTDNPGDFGFAPPLKETVLKIDRQRLAEYDITMQQFLRELSQHLRTTIGGERIKIKGEEVNLSIKSNKLLNLQAEELNKVTVLSNSGERIKLSDVADIQVQKTSSRISREEQQYSRSIRYSFRGPHFMAEEYNNSVINSTSLPPGYEISRELYRFLSVSEKKELYFIIGFAFLLVFMTTAALFESFLLPFIVMLTVPLSLIGVFLIFFFLDRGFDQSAYIGIVLLVGIVVNNSIILADHIQNLMREGKSVSDAVIEGARDRFRPIVITSATTVLAMIPFMIKGLGEFQGESFWGALSIAAIGGLTASTVLTLTFIPVMFILFKKYLRFN